MERDTKSCQGGLVLRKLTSQKVPGELEKSICKLLTIHFERYLVSTYVSPVIFVWFENSKDEDCAELATDYGHVHALV